MLLRFTVENYLSFKEKATINFQAAPIKEYKENIYSSVISTNPPLLKSIGIYGQNSSGKSNIIKAISFMKDFILNSSKESNSSQLIPIEPFLLSTVSETLASTFEVICFIDETRYRYGFAVNNKTVESEWLFYSTKRKEEKLFVRAKQNYSFEKEFKSTLKGKFELFAEVTRPNSLFLSVLAQFNNPLCQKISEWFYDLIIANDTAHLNLIESTARLMSTGDYRKMINDVMRKSDLGIESIQEKLIESASNTKSFKEFISSILTDDEKYYSIKTIHTRYDEENKEKSKVFFDLLKNESLGTQKFFGIIGPILYALKQKKIFIIDELDARIHSLLFENIVSLFNSNKFNPNGSQLIFTSHNTHVLKKGLRRDQMYFTDKDYMGASSLDSLHNKNSSVRNDASFDKDYLSGKYAAIPNLGSQLNLFDSI